MPTRFARLRRARDRHGVRCVPTRFARLRRARDRHGVRCVPTRFAWLRRARDRHGVRCVPTRFAWLRRARDRHGVRCVPTRFARLRRARDRHGGLHIRGGLSVVAGAHRVLVVVQHGHVKPDIGQRMDERGQRTVTGPADLGLHAVDLDGRRDAGRAAVVVGSVHMLPYPLQRPHRGQILLGERIPHLLGRDLATLACCTLCDLLDYLGKLDLQPPRQGKAVVGLHDVGHAALAGLRVDPDHRLVGAPDIARVDGQIRHLPQHVVDVTVGGIRIQLHRV